MESGDSRRLPPGPHGIPAEVVARNQRERLVAAMAEVCAERGYAEASVAAVAKRAGVSSVTFYEQFAGKKDCLLAAHRELLERLLEEVDRAREEEPEARERAAIRTVLTLLAADPPSARLLSVEILATGPEGAASHAAAVEGIGARLLPTFGRGETPDGAALAPAEWARMAGMLALIGQRVTAGEAGSLPELEDELAEMF